MIREAGAQTVSLSVPQSGQTAVSLLLALRPRLVLGVALRPVGELLAAPQEVLLLTPA